MRIRQILASWLIWYSQDYEKAVEATLEQCRKEGIHTDSLEAVLKRFARIKANLNEARQKAIEKANELYNKKNK